MIGAPNVRLALRVGLRRRVSASMSSSARVVDRPRAPTRGMLEAEVELREDRVVERLPVPALDAGSSPPKCA